MLPCGHMCGGISNETTCLPCLHGCGDVSSLKQDADDMCMICFIEALAYAPALQVGNFISIQFIFNDLFSISNLFIMFR